MGERKNRIRGLMDERPRITYAGIAEKSGYSHPTIKRWMADEPTERQARIVENAIQSLRRGD